MAVSLRGLCRLNLSLANNVFFKTNFLNVGARFVYTESSLGITSYENTRYLFRNQFMSIENTFRNKMAEVCDKEDGVVFTEDLKAMVHLAQKDENDLNLIVKMITKYVMSHDELKFGSYVFGPVVMRMFYYLNEPKLALSTFSDPNLDKFFIQKSSLQILMCLLYKHEMYNEMKQVYNSLRAKEHQIELSRFCTYTLIAACYKENTPEALTFATNCWKDMKSVVNRPYSRSTALLAALALKQNVPEMTLEILSSLQGQQFINIRCLKVLAYMDLNKFVQIIPLFKNTLEQESTAENKQTFFANVIYALEEKLKTTSEQDLSELFQLIEALKKQERLTSHMTLEENLLKPLHLRGAQKRNIIPDKRREYRTNTSRVGLREIL